MSKFSPPLSTYRLQLNQSFGFAQVAKIVPYLAELGISHLYLSPILQAVPQSMHGYDVVNPLKISADLGGAEDFEKMSTVLKKYNIQKVLEIVPNHMAIDTPLNKWWWDVLENGPYSAYSFYFDIDWDPPEEKLRNRILLAILGEHYGVVLDKKQIHIKRQGGKFIACYYDKLAPISPHSIIDLLSEVALRLGDEFWARNEGQVEDINSIPTYMELESIVDAILNLPLKADRASIRKRHREKEVIAKRLEKLCLEDPEVSTNINLVLEEINSDPVQLDKLLEKQHYRLAFWRTANHELDYRRFFDINTLVGVRPEDPQVFEDTHGRILSLVSDGEIQGLRIDHPDGLAEPKSYLDQLYEKTNGLWIVVEKILHHDEELPSSWSVAGTTGYELGSWINNVLLDSSAKQQLEDGYVELSGNTELFEDIAHKAKHRVLTDMLAADLSRLVASFVSICEAHKNYRDYTRQELAQVLEETLVCFEIYRTYVDQDGNSADTDKYWINKAIKKATKKRPDLDPALFDFLSKILTGQIGNRSSLEAKLRIRFQQLSSPVMAKSTEDCAFYVYNRLMSLNEVGSDPSLFGISIDQFHSKCVLRQNKFPFGLSSTSTHDTKRSEDVRARINVLSQIPNEWLHQVRQWMKENQKYKTNNFPDSNDEYLFYQTLFGAWPISISRISAYMAKATKEAKVFTSWVDPNQAYDEALQRFIESVLSDKEFISKFKKFTETYIEAGQINSLSQTALRLCLPGIPDTYQGCELWDLSLVDPDNRRPVDFNIRYKLLKELPFLSTKQIWDRKDEGLAKLAVIKACLDLRNQFPDSFGKKGIYEPIIAKGVKSDHVIGFLRGSKVAVIVPRLILNKDYDWEDTFVKLPPGNWKDYFSQAEFNQNSILVKTLFKDFPISLLSRQD